MLTLEVQAPRPKHRQKVWPRSGVSEHTQIDPRGRELLDR